MTFRIQYTWDVEQDVKEIIQWYNEKSLLVAAHFLSQLKQAEERLLANPLAFRKISKQGFRRIIIKKFPYSVYFM